MDFDEDVERIAAEDLDFPPTGFPNKPADLSRITLVCLGHAHIDLGYRWDFRETVHKVAPWTFAGVLDLMDRTPGLTFCQSQMWLYREVQREYPELFRRIREKIAAGVWEVVGGAWCEYDAVLPSGEALIRQHLQGVTYAAEHLGVTRHTVAFVPDSFIAHAATLPQILTGCGFRAYLLCRGLPVPPGRPEATRRAFRWIGPDGSELVAFAPFGPYANPTLTPDYLATLSPHAHASVCPDELTLYGVGDHGGGPRDADIAALRNLRTRPGMPGWRYGRADDYVERAFGRETTRGLCAHRGPLVSFATGGLVSQAQIKRANRLSEWQLLRTEAASAIGVLLQRKPASPRADLQEIWRDVLTLQFHDILPGTSVASVYRDARAIYARVAARMADLLRDAMARIGARLDTRGEGACLLVFNAALKPFGGFARVPVPQWLTAAGYHTCSLQDDEGHSVPAIQQGGNLLFPVTLPPLGYRLHRIVPGTPDVPTDAPPRFGKHVLESRRFRIEFDPETGDILSIRTPDGVEWLADRSNTLELFDEHEMATSWVVVPRGPARRFVMEAPPSVTESNAFFTTVSCACRCGLTCVTRETTVYHTLERIDCALRIDWHEGNACLSLAVRPRLDSPRVRTATSHGHVTVSDPRQPFCTHEWVDAADGVGGLAIMTDGIYGASYDDGALSLLVIRTARDMDPEMAQGPHELRYAIYPHQGETAASRLEREVGNAFSGIACRWEPPHPGALKSWSRTNPALPARDAFIGTDADNVMLCAVKLPEDAFTPFAFVIRVREVDGRATRCRVRLPAVPVSVVRADHLERPSGESLPFEGRDVPIALKAFELLTFIAHV